MSKRKNYFALLIAPLTIDSIANVAITHIATAINPLNPIFSPFLVLNIIAKYVNK